jgi:hypothetical protein
MAKKEVNTHKMFQTELMYQKEEIKNATLKLKQYKYENRKLNQLCGVLDQNISKY